MIDLDNCIFKYGLLEYAEVTLNKLTLPFSRLCSYNDIYEDEFQMIFNIRRDSVKKFEDEIISQTTAARLKFEIQLDNYLVTCFSKQADISLMWSHYADSHKGVCYCFDFTEPNPIFETPINSGPVKYSNLLPKINVYQDHTLESMVREMTTDVVLTKPIEWSYEKEIRFWYDSTAMCECKYDPSSLKALIVGRRVSTEQIDSISKTIESFNSTHFTDLEILYAYRKKKVYDLGICSGRKEKEWKEAIKHNTSVVTLSEEGNPILT